KTIQHIDLSLHTSNPSESWSIVGKIADQVFGNWTSEGTLDPKTGDIVTHAVCPSLRLTGDLIGSLGSKVDWLRRDFDISGEIGIDANLHGSLDGSLPVSYQVFLDPRNARVRFQTVPEPIRDLTGRIEITPDEVRIHGVTGDLAS